MAVESFLALKEKGTIEYVACSIACINVNVYDVIKRVFSGETCHDIISFFLEVL